MRPHTTNKQSIRSKIRVILISLMIGILTFNNASIVRALEPSDYMSQDIEFYSRNGSACTTTPSTAASTPLTGSVTGDLDSAKVPEPMRSAMITAAKKYNVAPAAVAALYVTEQNGFDLEYKYYDSKLDPSVFNLTTTSPEWKLSTFGTTGIWPQQGTFRGPFQFGGIWESTYAEDGNGDGKKDVYNFFDEVYGAAHYLADLGATLDKGLDGVRKAARDYNGQSSWDIGSGIRNPDPAKFALVRDLYADQVVFLTKALANSTAAATTPKTETKPKVVEVSSFMTQPTINLKSADVSETTTATLTSNTVSISDNTRLIWQLLQGKGLAPAQIAGIMGNMEAESSLNPKALEPAPATGHGLIQWSFGRWRDDVGRDGQSTSQADLSLSGSSASSINSLLGYAARQNKPWTDISLQIDFLWYEITAGNEKGNAAGFLAEKSDPVQSAILWHNEIERSSDTPTSSQFIRRQNSAKALFDQVAGLGLTSIISAGGASCGAETVAVVSASSGGPTSGANLVTVPPKGAGKNINVIAQCDQPAIAVPGGGSYDTCECGCGPTSLTMIRNSLETKPVPIANVVGDIWSRDGMEGGCGGRKWVYGPYMQSLGYTVEPLTGNDYRTLSDSDLTAIKTKLEAGYLILTHSSSHIRGPYTQSSKGRGSTPGHFLVIRAIDPSGNFYIANPGAGAGDADQTHALTPADIKGWLDYAQAYKLPGGVAKDA